MVETSQTHRAELEHVPSAADFDDAISDDPASAGLLSESEVESLLRGHAAMETVSKEQAQSDVSLLFRTLQSAYGAYEYFGQEKFDAAEDAVTQWLSSQNDEIKVSPDFRHKHQTTSQKKKALQSASVYIPASKRFYIVRSDGSRHEIVVLPLRQPLLFAYG